MSKNKTQSLILAAACTGLLAFAGVASAQTPAPPAGQAPAAGAQRAPWIVACEADMNKHCAAEMKANTDVRPCLAKNEATLSQSCQDVFLKRYKVLELCKDDFEKHCKGVEGKGLGKCINDNAEKLSDKCKGALRKGSNEAKKEEAAATKATTTAEKTETKAAKKKAKKTAE